MKALLISAALLALAARTAAAQDKPLPSGIPVGVPVHMVITAEPFHGAQAEPLTALDVNAWQDATRLPVTALVPLRGPNAALDFYILIDERIDPAQTALFDQLRKFVIAQAPETAIGIAYMFNGEARIAQPPTKDHARAVQKLRASSGFESAGASPYTSLSVLFNGWTPGTALRREVLVVTDGMDRFNTIGDYNMYVDDAIADAQRTGVVVYTMYAPALGHAGHSPELIRWGHTYLGQLAEGTGGEAYLYDPSATPPLEKYFADLTQHFANQYLVTFDATPKADPYQGIRFEAVAQNADLIAARRFYLNPGVTPPLGQ